MMRIFIDANVLVDMMDAHRAEHAASKRILRAAEDRRVELVLTGLTLINALYAVRKAGHSARQVRAVVEVILSIVIVASTDMPQLQAALGSEWPDFEDAVQYHAALSTGRVEFIVTSDQRGFKTSRIPVLSPRDFVEGYLK